MKNIKEIRSETPGCAHKNHLNSAGSSLVPKLVIDAILDYLKLETITGGYETAALKAKEISGFYKSLATMLNCEPRNIAHASSATEAYSKALSSIPFKKGDVILTTDYDYASNQIAFLFLQKKIGVKLVRAANNTLGGVNFDSVKKLIKKEDPKLVAITHVPTNTGLVQPVEEIGTLCRKKEILYLVDACQSAGQMSLDVEKIQCDFLSATFRKFMRGPRGIGFLYVSNRVLKNNFEPIFPDLHGAVWTKDNEYKLTKDAKRFEYWEKPYALMLGAKASVDYALGIGLENIERRVTHLANYTRQKLSKIENVRVLDEGEKLCGIVTAWNKNWNLSALQKHLRELNINVSVAPFNAAVIDFEKKGVDGALRISPHYFNTEREIDELFEAIINFK
ncbi:aminotransferase class V-fold PLP-dependent enzyme [Saprospiraceae bacterium]|jgi:selenocysteine lyase/cysteine desulfurase|nr:aminotransferase class V-fold PLP-dependent enzyme [Bacteroidota bacterium]MDB4727751.1 aminotransferase class V-fold PLP-dependent enzyme [Saprospiraceae bacterium]MDF1863249.1 aminotransferase class V-fold PLP-dependent enzyme [Saprospiraceae bacterium]